MAQCGELSGAELMDRYRGDKLPGNESYGYATLGLWLGAEVRVICVQCNDLGHDADDGCDNVATNLCRKPQLHFADDVCTSAAEPGSLLYSGIMITSLYIYIYCELPIHLPPPLYIVKGGSTSSYYEAQQQRRSA